MKKRILTAVCLCLLMVFSVVFTACHTPQNVERINGIRTVYRYNIELQMRNADDNTLLDTSKVAKYWYTNTRPQGSYVTTTYGSADIDELNTLFPDAVLVWDTGDVVSNRYQKTVEIVIMLKGNPHAYRPQYSKVGKMVTVTGYTFDCMCENNIAVKEMWTDSNEKKLKEMQDQAFLLKDSPVELKAYMEKFQKEFFGACFLDKTRTKFDLATTGLTIIYSR